MSDAVTYSLSDSIATITIDDGKVNALSLDRFAEINAAFDQAEADNAMVILTGREGIFSAGFDLKSLGADPVTVLDAGFGLALRIFSFPKPVVVACPGHTIAMGVFLTLSADYRIGARGDFKIVANEVALGMPMPLAAIEVARQRLAPAHFHRAMNLAETYNPDDAVAAGFLDEVVEPGELADRARAKATELAALNMNAHASTKSRVREQALAAIRAGLERDKETFAGMRAPAGS